MLQLSSPQATRVIGRVGVIAATAVLAVGAAGCAAEGTVGYAYGYPSYGYYDQYPGYIALDTVPYDVYSYPRAWYQGGYAYWDGGRWLYPTQRGWFTFRSEPTELGRYRTRYRGTPYFASPPVRPYPRGYYPYRP